MKVKLFLGMVLFEGTRQTPHIQVRIEHHGGPPLMFSDNCTSIEIEGKVTQLLLWDNKLTDVTKWPHETRPGMAFYVMSEKSALLEAIRKVAEGNKARIRASVTDAILRGFKSDWVDVDLDAPL